MKKTCKNTSYTENIILFRFMDFLCYSTLCILYTGGIFFNSMIESFIFNIFFSLERLQHEHPHFKENDTFPSLRVEE